ncbi:sulfatase [Aestuariimicrobium soli]|uniref:sulfatase n=1 Tax=Aestuariimicrobium soli TaxID=2035834 RepID=UPI003EB80DC4
MRAVVLMFDSLNRLMLPPYGCTWTHAPNFARLAERTVTFDTCYAGSMPCMPARRELHTGRHNFLHRSWGPLEPFDDSMPQLLDEAGVHTHLVTDHYHYWEDGGATYHNRFTTYELFRGQEGDAWKGRVGGVQEPPTLRRRKNRLYRQDLVNRQYLQGHENHPQTRTVNAGLDFVTENLDRDRWLLWLECFDPHEPFFSTPEAHELVPSDYRGPTFDWPDYKRVEETPEQVEHLRREYAALLAMCDASLGRVLDAFDEHGLWDDTLLIVCTDHGFLLGEHDWYGKNVQPWYEENIHTPLFIWDPRAGIAGERRAELVQTIDLPPTLLEWFGVAVPPDMQGRDLAPVVARSEPVREAGIFGIFGGHVNVTDGRYVYMRSCADENRPLLEHTLMPTHMTSRFSVDELAAAELVEGFDFTKGLKVLRMPGSTMGSPTDFGTLLWDLENDPGQLSPVVDNGVELRMATLLRDLMVVNDAPESQFERLGLPRVGEITAEHCLARSSDSASVG